MESEVRRSDGFRIIFAGRPRHPEPFRADPEQLAGGALYSASRALLEIPGSRGAEPVRAFCTPRVAAEVVRMLEEIGGIDAARGGEFLALRRELIEATSAVALARAPGRWAADYGVFEALGERRGWSSAIRWHAVCVTPSEGLAVAFARYYAGGAREVPFAPLSTYIVELVPGLRERRVADFYLRDGSHATVEAAVAPETLVSDPYLLLRRVPRGSGSSRRPVPLCTSTESAA